MFYIIVSLTTILIIALDRITKLLAVNNIAPGEIVDFIPGLIFLTRVYNPGAAWGIFGEHTIILAIFSLVASIIFGILINYYIKKDQKIHALSLAVVLGGALGNMISRFMTVNGSRIGVVDMIGFDFMNFPIFNIADVAIVCGFIVFSIMIIFFDKPKNKQLEKINELEQKAFKELESDIHDSSTK